jgi:hypothetical protein
VRWIALFTVLAAAALSTAPVVAAQPHHAGAGAKTKAHAAHATKKKHDDVPPDAGFGKVAPADEYFGRLKMSVLGIRNQLNHLQAQVEGSPETSESIMGNAALVEDAIHDWERHYPKDPWLAKTVYSLTHVYANVRSDSGHAHAMESLHWLTARYQKAGFSEKAQSEVSAFGAPAGQAASQAQPH